MFSPFSTVCKKRFKLKLDLILVLFNIQSHAGDTNEHFTEVYINSTTYKKNVISQIVRVSADRLLINW